MEQGTEEVPVVYLHDIKRQYTQGETKLTILDGAKLALWAGQSVALVAPSGSGKSTLLHIAGLLESPDEGRCTSAEPRRQGSRMWSGRKSGAPISGSSISRTVFCRNSRRSKMSCCRR